MKAPRRPTLLILGGTGEAAALARNAVARFGDGLLVVTSLAGRTASPAPLPGAVRSGGFGGADGLATYLARDFDRSRGRCDASLRGADLAPCAARVRCHGHGRGSRWCARRGGARRSDRWIEVPDMAAAARALPGLGRRAFLTIGARELDAFAACEGVAFVVRLIEPPRAPLPLAGAALVLGAAAFLAGRGAASAASSRRSRSWSRRRAAARARPSSTPRAKWAFLCCWWSVRRARARPRGRERGRRDRLDRGTQIGVEARRMRVRKTTAALAFGMMLGVAAGPRRRHQRQRLVHRRHGGGAQPDRRRCRTMLAQGGERSRCDRQPERPHRARLRGLLRQLRDGQAAARSRRPCRRARPPRQHRAPLGGRARQHRDDALPHRQQGDGRRGQPPGDHAAHAGGRATCSRASVRP